MQCPSCPLGFLGGPLASAESIDLVDDYAINLAGLDEVLFAQRVLSKWNI
jgi:hypothetical protein